MGRSDSSGTEDTQRRESAQDIENAYRQGVEEVANDPVIFVDPDKIKRRRIGPPGRMTPSFRGASGHSLERQMEGQVEGSAQAVLDWANDDPDEPDETMNELATELRKADPAAIRNIDINSVTYGIAIIPKYTIDSKKDIIREFLKHKDLEFDRVDRRTILENMPGTDAQWARLIGNHEGVHLNNRIDYGDRRSNIETLIEETRADRITIEMLRARGEDDLALAFKDLRSLSSRIDPTHSSAPLLNSSDKVRVVHLITAWNHREITDQTVEDNYDWASHSGKADTPRELLQENPDAYFETANNALLELEAEVMEAYEEDPTSLEVQKAVIEAQIMIDYQRNFEDAYRRRVLGQDIPEREPTQLITQKQEDAYYVEVVLRPKIEEQERDLKISAYKGELSVEELFKDFDWDAYEGDETAWEQLDLKDSLSLELELLEEIRMQVLEDHENNPSYETTERLLQLEHAINGRAEALGHIIADDAGIEPPEHTRIVLVSEEDKRAYYVERIERADEAAAVEAGISEVSQNHYLDTRASYVENAFESFDWDAYEGDATNPEELYEEKPEAYFQTEIAYLENFKYEAMESYNADPSYENTGKLLEAQYLINDRYDAINIERDELNGPAPRLHEPLDRSPFVPDEVRRTYYLERIEREAMTEANKDAEVNATTEQPYVEEDKGYQKGPDGTPYTTEVSGLITGKTDANLREGELNIGQTPIMNVFLQAADPDPNKISFLHAKAPEENTPIRPPARESAFEVNKVV